MIVTRRGLSRRTVLRGMGASLALPLLDGMVPAFASPQTVRRFGAVYVPNGMSLPHFFPETSEPGFALSPTLKPLEPFRDRLVVFSGLANLVANARGTEGVGDHSRGAGTFLSGVPIKKTEGSDIRSGTTVDQIAAHVLGRETQLGSLQLAMESNEISGACDSGYSCAYMNTISWSNPTTPLPMERDPRAVFERMFGGSDSTDRDARLARIEQDRSVLDVVNAEARRLNSTLADRATAGAWTSTWRPCAAWSTASSAPKSRATGSCRSSRSRAASRRRSPTMRSCCTSCRRWRSRPT